MMNEKVPLTPPATSPTSIEQGPLSPAIVPDRSAGLFQPIQTKQKKTVRFADKCKVVLIPQRQEYTAVGIFLWWTKSDFVTWKKGSLFELELQRMIAIKLIQIQESNATTPSSSVTQEQEELLEESRMSMSK